MWSEDSEVSQQKPIVQLDTELAMRLGLVTLKCPDCGSEVTQTYPGERYWGCQNMDCAGGEDGDGYTFYMNETVIQLGTLA